MLSAEKLRVWSPVLNAPTKPAGATTPSIYTIYVDRRRALPRHFGNNSPSYRLISAARALCRSDGGIGFGRDEAWIRSAWKEQAFAFGAKIGRM